MKKIIFLVSLSTILFAVPNAPSNLVLTPKIDQVLLSWSDNSDDESGFKIFRDNTLVAITPPNATHFIDRGLNPSTAYNYMIKATDDSHDYNAIVNPNSWYVYTNNQENALKKTYDNTIKKDVISLKTYNGKSIGMQIGNNENDSRSIVTWEQNIKGRYKIYIKIKTTKGDRYLTYIPNGSDKSLHDNQYLDIGISPSKDGEWSSITRDIAKDLKRVESDNEFISFDIFLIRSYSEAKLGSITLSQPSTSVTDGFDLGFTKKSNGVELNSIKYKNEELLSSDNLPIFSFIIRDNSKNQKSLDSLSGWSDIIVSDSGNSKIITLKNPTDSFFPSSLIATIIIDLKGDKSSWDLKIDGVGSSFSIMNVTFPNLSIKSDSNDHFLIPRLFGKVIDNPKNSINVNLRYPWGKSATMQYLAYYNNNYGLYFGFHDPKASIKNFIVKTESGNLHLSANVLAENQTKMGNNFNFPGEFELDYFKGDWYDATNIYKEWVYKSAEYRPSTSKDKLARAKEIGDVSICTVQSYSDSSNINRKQLINFKEFLKDDTTDVTVLAHIDTWNGEAFDKDYPDVFLKTKEGLEDILTEFKTTYGNKLKLQLYTNGYIYDHRLASYESFKQNSVKDENGVSDAYGNWANIMCPTQKPWHDKHIEINRFISSLGVDAVYLDQVTASHPGICLDPTHNHTLGGGHYWRDGYKSMLSKIHKVYPSNKFITTESANDFLMDEVDSYLTMYYTTQNQVPAMQIIYGGKVQFLGPTVGTSTFVENNNPDSENLYATLAQGFTFGEIPVMFQSIFDNIGAKGSRKEKAASYVKSLAIMREKLKSYISYGEMKKPLTISGNIPTIDVPRATKFEPFSIKAIQTGIWKRDDGSILVVFVNANTPDKSPSSIKFSFDFKADEYGLSGDLKIREIKPYSQRTLPSVSNHFTREVELQSAGVVAYIISK